MTDNYTEDTTEDTKKPSEGRLRYYAHYGKQRPLIVQVKGRHIAEIYERRGFTEVNKEEFHRLWGIIKQSSK